MAPQENHFGVDLTDEVVRGAIVTHNGEIVPTAPRSAPPPPAAPSTKAATGAKETEVVALTPWQKTTREVAIVTAGMGSVLALGKATGPLFMGNVFTFALAGLIGYRVVWGVAPALHSPLMSVTNAISGAFSKSPLTIVMELTCVSSRHGRRRRVLHHGRRNFAADLPASPGCSIGSPSICERLRRFRDHKAHA